MPVRLVGVHPVKAALVIEVTAGVPFVTAVVTVKDPAVPAVNEVLPRLMNEMGWGAAAANGTATKDRPTKMRAVAAKAERRGAESLRKLNLLFLPFPITLGVAQPFCIDGLPLAIKFPLKRSGK